MTVKELREQLANLPDDMQLFLQVDPEGNGYHKVRGIDAEVLAAFDKEGHLDSQYPIEHGADGNCVDEDEWKNMLKTLPRIGIVYP